MWIEQKPGYGLGNFVALTPAIRTLSSKHGPVSVYFDHKGLEEVYKLSPMIHVLEKRPSDAPLNTCGVPSQDSKRESDYFAWHRILIGANGIKNSVVPFVPSVSTSPRHPGKVAVFHGCAGTIYRDKKDLGIELREALLKDLIANKYHPIIIGNRDDWNNYWKDTSIPDDCEMYFDLSVLAALKQISKCGLFISNDTGFSHMAAAMGLPGTIYWRDTDMIKNKVPSKDVKHLQVERII